jgi:uncharacterized protein YunC (DUF1805 family)
MIETELHFFQVEREVFATHTVVTLELGLCIALAVLDAVNVVVLAHGAGFLMVAAIALEAIEHEAIVGAEAVGVDDALGHDLRLADWRRVLRYTFSTMRV